MLTRLHISSFIGLTILVWLIALYVQGKPVLDADFIKPFSVVVGLITAFVALFNKYLWSLRIFRGWYVKRPDLRGTWVVELKSSWKDPSTNVDLLPIRGYAVIRQTLTSLSIRVFTEESKSFLVAHSIEQQEDDDLFKIFGLYRNEPKIELQGVKSEIHYGSFALEIHGSPAEELDGHYWTDRGTRGGMKLFGRVKKLYSTFEQAKAEIS
jgi:ABC-type multidrug transport system fused ATPase/permease subunit